MMHCQQNVKYNSCVLTDPPTLISVKTQRGWENWRGKICVYSESSCTKMYKHIVFSYR